MGRLSTAARVTPNFWRSCPSAPRALPSARTSGVPEAPGATLAPRLPAGWQQDPGLQGLLAGVLSCAEAWLRQAQGTLPSSPCWSRIPVLNMLPSLATRGWTLDGTRPCPAHPRGLIPRTKLDSSSWPVLRLLPAAHGPLPNCTSPEASPDPRPSGQLILVETGSCRHCKHRAGAA